MRRFKQFLEAKNKTIVFTFGRMNPPTIGHEKLVNMVKANARGVDSRIFLSQTQDKKKNPLPFADKLRFVKKAFKGVKISTDKSINTIFAALEQLNKEGYKNVVLVVGQDRVVDFRNKIAPFINNPRKTPNLEFNFTVISAGERDPDAEGTEGMSASKMRQLASIGDIDEFSFGTPNGLNVKDKRNLFQAVRKGMGLK